LVKYIFSGIFWQLKSFFDFSGTFLACLKSYISAARKPHKNLFKNIKNKNKKEKPK